MSSPSKPLAIGSPRGRDSAAAGAASETALPLGTPDNRALRAAYIGTPPVPNIPPRGGTPRLGSDSPSSNNLALPKTGSSNDIVNSFASRKGSTFGGRRPATPGSPGAVSIDIDDLPEEEKARILRRHLVSGNDRRLDKKPSTDADFPSLSSGSTPRGGPSRAEPEQETDVFPVPYHTPGADIVYALNYLQLGRYTEYTYV
jgi:solute carrier family 36 (proton-coupled amino acid transporter)